MTSELDKKIKRLKEKRDSKIDKIRLETLDEVEIHTPHQWYVIGVDYYGELIIGETPISPRFVEVRSIRENNITFPRNMMKELRIGEGTDYIRAKIFTLGKDILIRPFKLPDKWDGRNCAWCGNKISDVPRYYKPCTLTTLGIKWGFCSKTHRQRFREEKIGKGRIKYEDLKKR